MKKAESTTLPLEVSIPPCVENLQLPDPSLITYYKNLENRILWLDSEVDDVFLEYGKYIIQWNQEDKNIPIEERKPIKLLFFSPGGFLNVNNAMIDIIELSKTPIYGINIGEAASAGCFMFLACHKRYALPKAVFLIHKGSGNFSGTYDEIICEILEYQRQMEELSIHVLSHSNIDEDTFQEHFGTEWYVPAEQALEYGIIDAIIDDLDDVL